MAARARQKDLDDVPGRRFFGSAARFGAAEREIVAEAEAKGAGFDVKILRKVVRLRKQDRAKRQEEEAILDLYLSAIGEI